MNLFIETGLSKIIIYRDSIDKVIGYIHSSEMFRTNGEWQSRVQDVPIVPDTMAGHKLMKLFMKMANSMITLR